MLLQILFELLEPLHALEGARRALRGCRCQLTQWLRSRLHLLRPPALPWARVIQLIKLNEALDLQDAFFLPLELDGLLICVSSSNLALFRRLRVALVLDLNACRCLRTFVGADRVIAPSLWLETIGFSGLKILNGSFGRDLRAIELYLDFRPLLFISVLFFCVFWGVMLLLQKLRFNFLLIIRNTLLEFLSQSPSQKLAQHVAIVRELRLGTLEVLGVQVVDVVWVVVAVTIPSKPSPAH